MKHRLKQLGIVVLMLLFVACSTSKTFYNTTYNHVSTDHKDIYRLDLSGYDKEIDLSKYKKLRVLNLSNIKNITILNSILKSITNPKQLKILLLNSNHLTTLPTSISRFTELEQLSLNNNKNLDVNTTFKQIASLPLKFLDYQFNELRAIPQQIVGLKTLKDLNLSNNQLELHQGFKYLAALPELKSLWLRNNQLTVLDANINQLSQLVHLYLEHNQLSTLPKQLDGLKSLRVLHLSFNDFIELPETLQTVPHLILLHIDHCNIKHIANTFNVKTTSIRGLVLHKNKLSEDIIDVWKSKFKSFFLLIF